MQGRLSCANEWQQLGRGSMNTPQEPPETSKPTLVHLALPALDSWLGNGHTTSQACYQNR